MFEPTFGGRIHDYVGRQNMYKLYEIQYKEKLSRKTKCLRNQ